MLPRARRKPCELKQQRQRRSTWTVRKQHVDTLDTLTLDIRDIRDIEHRRRRARLRPGQQQLRGRGVDKQMRVGEG